MCVFLSVCLNGPNELAKRRTDMILIYNVASLGRCITILGEDTTTRKKGLSRYLNKKQGIIIRREGYFYALLPIPILLKRLKYI